MILLAYDGSADARAAIENAAELFADQPVTVLTVWEPFVEVVARTTVGFGMVPSIPDADEIDAASSKQRRADRRRGRRARAEAGAGRKAADARAGDDHRSERSSPRPTGSTRARS